MKTCFLITRQAAEIISGILCFGKSAQRHVTWPETLTKNREEDSERFKRRKSKETLDVVHCLCVVYYVLCGIPPINSELVVRFAKRPRRREGRVPYKSEGCRIYNERSVFTGSLAAHPLVWQTTLLSLFLFIVFMGQREGAGWRQDVHQLEHSDTSTSLVIYWTVTAPLPVLSNPHHSSCSAPHIHARAIPLSNSKILSYNAISMPQQVNLIPHHSMTVQLLNRLSNNCLTDCLLKHYHRFVASFIFCSVTTTVSILYNCVCCS